MTIFDEGLTRCREAREAGDAALAFQHLRPLFRDHPDLDDVPTLLRLIEELAVVAKALDVETVATAAAAVTVENPQTLYDLGYAMIDTGIAAEAAPPLFQAYRLARSSVVLGELCCALEHSNRHQLAARLLEEAPDLLADAFVLRYQRVLYWCYAGDLQAARKAMSELGQAPGDAERFVEERVRGILARADVVQPEPGDLRAWHWVLGSSLLLHVSPHGFPEPMHGRYAFVQSSPTLVRENVERVILALDAWKIDVTHVVAAPARGSQILATIVAQRLGVPVAAFGSPGLIVSYDLADESHDTLMQLGERKVDAPLFAHALSWTDPPRVTPDLVGMLYQNDIAPWGPQLRVDPQTQQTSQGPADEREVAVIAAEILAAEPEEFDASPLRAFATKVGPLAPGPRGRLFGMGPVPSARFC